ncbi:hypothetical protein EYF80_018510 [Liparis tanakae]|uniref:Uncharacterized protein n=1 Tax=Liparis tanakae TaxID=230148 RepID=A0A4Z2I091_9TELE|nr:hypothetical protein EYF80_018510 [Liparis tanakae]
MSLELITHPELVELDSSPPQKIVLGTMEGDKDVFNIQSMFVGLCEDKNPLTGEDDGASYTAERRPTKQC